MDMVQINDISDFESLPINKWNIPEPPLDQPRSNGKSQYLTSNDIVLT